jgi:hypothetical protein
MQPPTNLHYIETLSSFAKPAKRGGIRQCLQSLFKWKHLKVLMCLVISIPFGTPVIS